MLFFSHRISAACAAAMPFSAPAIHLF